VIDFAYVRFDFLSAVLLDFILHSKLLCLW